MVMSNHSEGGIIDFLAEMRKRQAAQKTPGQATMRAPSSPTCFVGQELDRQSSQNVRLELLHSVTEILRLTNATAPLLSREQYDRLMAAMHVPLLTPLKPSLLYVQGYALMVLTGRVIELGKKPDC
jgi:hypothetical protein